MRAKFSRATLSLFHCVFPHLRCTHANFGDLWLIPWLQVCRLDVVQSRFTITQNQTLALPQFSMLSVGIRISFAGSTSDGRILQNDLEFRDTTLLVTSEDYR